MPVYTVKNINTDAHMNMSCPYSELKNFLEENEEWKQVFKMPATVSGRISTHRLAGQEWSDVLKKVKKASGKDAKINV
jgi:hypothetical protein